MNSRGIGNGNSYIKIDCGSLRHVMACGDSTDDTPGDGVKNTR